MPSKYERKFLEDGVTPNPKYKPDTRNGDRHLDKSDRHHISDDRHVNRNRRKTDFITIDGEGITTGKYWYAETKSGREPVHEHIYVLLTASSGESIKNPNGLSTVECFDFLLELSQKYPDAIFACFGASYDINMIFRDIPKEKLKELWENKSNNPDIHPTRIELCGKKYSLSYLPRKSLTIRLVGDPPYLRKAIRHKSGAIEFTGGFAANYAASIKLYDVLGFFQYRFVDALGDDKKGYFTEYLHKELVDGMYHEVINWSDGSRTDLTQMKSMKNKRSSFTADQIEKEIAPYCQDETIALQRLMERLRGYLEEAKIVPSKWHGSGSCASALLEREHIKEHMHENIPDKSLKNAQLHAYSAGRAEMGKFGVYIGKVYNYDLHSAFPSVMPELPSLTLGMWRSTKGASNKPYSLSRVKWSFYDELPFFPFFYRERTGGIYFPPTGEGWYWKPELDSALNAWQDGKLSSKEWDGNIEVVESWEFQPYYDTKPFAFIPDLYQLRKSWKSLGKSAEKVLKFTIASIYGKLAQSIGGSDKQRPPYHNIGYAGYITSSIRARLFDAVMQAPENILMMTIDALYSTEPLDLPIGDGLGEWEVTEFDGIVIAQYGIYWSLKRLGREPTEQERQEELFDEKYLQYGGEWFRTTPHYQGYNRGTLTPAMVIEAWKKNKSEIGVSSTRFVTMASVMANDDLWPHWRTWRTIDRTLELHPRGKRVNDESFRKTKPYNNLVDTIAHTPPGALVGEMSSRFRLRWEVDEEPDYGTIDDIDHLLYEQELMDGEL